MILKAASRVYLAPVDSDFGTGPVLLLFGLVDNMVWTIWNAKFNKHLHGQDIHIVSRIVANNYALNKSLIRITIAVDRKYITTLNVSTSSLFV